jgi:hypothetical protein
MQIRKIVRRQTRVKACHKQDKITGNRNIRLSSMMMGQTRIGDRAIWSALLMHSTSTRRGIDLTGICDLCSFTTRALMMEAKEIIETSSTLTWLMAPDFSTFKIIFFNSNSGGGVQLGLLGTAATIGLLWWWRNWWNDDWQGKPKYSEETCPSATLSTTNSTYSVRMRTRAAAVGTQRLTAWAKARLF